MTETKPQTQPAPQPALPSPPELLTVPEVAAELRTDPATIRRWINEERLPAIRVGRDYRVEREQLDALLAQSRTSKPLTVRS